ncbi:thiamine pyrophosphate-dependent dehydrogenase E1 component subunit alpha [Oribacterium sp.]
MLDNLMKKNMLHRMMLIREFENLASEYKDKKYIYGGVHCYNGEEAVAVGVCSALNQDDYIISNHRPHGHALAKGVDPKKIMSEMFGKSTGTNKGKGGSMHIHDASVGMITSTGIVGSGIPVGCGAAFASKILKNNRISCVFFGDGSANEGVLHESLNLASIWGLPLLFLLEDNGLAITTNTRVTSAVNDYVKLASVYSIEGVHVDGQNVEEVYMKASAAAEFIRSNQRPYIIQAHTIRFKEHAEGDFYKRMVEKKYRDYGQLNMDMENKCPIKLFISSLLNSGEITVREVDELKDHVKNELASCIEFAINSPEPGIEQSMSDVFKEV